VRARTIALIATAAIGLGACGDDKGDTASTAAEPAAAAAPAPEATTATTPSSTGTATTSSGTTAGISKDLSSKPEIPKPSGDPPTKLVTKDIVVGKGRGAQAGDSLVMHYVGVLFSTGEQFDASWDSGRPFPFVLGQGNVIRGWDEGIKGMKVGGRRLLTIPPDLAYGDQGQGPIGPNSTLVFVVDLLNDTPGG
jgi:peptidylprolyl isomerase